jgi:phosphomannomutase
MYVAHTFNPTIIRQYDIRGTVGKTLHIADAGALGRAYGTMARRMGATTLAVGYDGRTHSPDFEKALVEGLLSTGINVECIGLGPTPMLYFATYHLKVDGGIMITGSHNPPDQNGFKMLMRKDLPKGGPIFGERIKELAALAANDDFVSGTGSVKQIDIREAYVDMLAKNYTNPHGFKIVWDNGNGAAGEILRRLVKRLPGEHILLFDEIDGNFPSRKPDPSDERNLQAMKDCILNNKCDLGIGFDGDADRIGAMDSKGRLVAGDQLLAIYAHEILQKHPGAPIIADVKASQVLFDMISKLGGKPVMWKTGHALIKSKMAEIGSPLAGEMSGHIFFGDNHGFDDSIYAGVRLMSLLANSGKSLAEWRDSLPPTFSTREIRVPIEEARKFEVVTKIKSQLTKDGANVNDIDGVRVNTEDGWWLLRASNTEAILVARAEGKSNEALERLKNQLSAQLRDVGLALPPN